MGGYGWIWEDKSPMGGPRGVPTKSQKGPKRVPKGQTISHHSDCPFCGVKVKNPSQNIKKTKAPAPRQHFILISDKDASLPTVPTRLQQQKAAPATSSFGRGQMVF